MNEFNRRFLGPFYTWFPAEGPLSRDKYPKVMDFYAQGKTHSQRVLFGGNRTRKTGTGLFESSLHITGLYHDWWPGYKFSHPIKAWIIGVTAEDTLDVLQTLLVGDELAGVQGLIPPQLVANVSYKYKRAIRTMYVKHFTNGVFDGYSMVTFKSDSEGREKFQGRRIDLALIDEECSDGVFEETVTRTMATEPEIIDGQVVTKENGLIIFTFTPLQGKTPLVRRLTEKEVPHRYVTTITWDDCPHLTDKAKREMLESFHPHTRDARSKGIASLGSGVIFPIPVDMVFIKPIPIPEHWFRWYGLDLGWNNTSAVFIAHDRDSDIMYIYSEYVGEKQIAAVNASSIKAMSLNGQLIGAADTSIMQINPKDGTRLIEEYRREGLKLVKPDKTVETGINVMWQRLQTGRLKVFNTCTRFKLEYENYHRDEEGKIVKSNDHLMDAARYGIVSGAAYGKTKYEIMYPDEINHNIALQRNNSAANPYTGL